MSRFGSRRLALPASLFALVFGLSAYFYNGYGWNQTARYDAIWAFVEPGPNQGTFRIDDFVTDAERGINTGDWARNPEHSEHYYANKAPGTSFLGVPVYWAIYHTERLAGIDPTAPGPAHVNAYLLHLGVTVLPVALSALFFFQLLGLLGRSRSESLWLTLLLYAGTLLWPFSTMLWGHATAAALVVVSLYCFARGGPRYVVAAGLFAGMAVLTDYGAIPYALSLPIGAALLPGRERRVRDVVVGGAAPLAVFLLYHGIAFGSPFRLASSYSPAEMISEGRFLGLFGAPAWGAIWGLSFSTSRGLFFFMPVLTLGLLALRTSDPEHRAWAWFAAGNVLALYLVNMTFNAWQGGLTTGPRYQIAALPFWILLVALLPRGRRMTGALIGLAAVSVANMAVIAAVSPQAPDAFRGSPLLFCWAKLAEVVRIDLGLVPAPPPGRSLSAGSLHLYPLVPLRDPSILPDDPVIARFASFNLGELLLGLRGTLSLLPALLFAAGGATLAHVLARREDSTPTSGSESLGAL